jgi:serine/threonine protein kinase
VHRDFKPANVKLKPNGTVKVLDFGLAKQSRDREAEVHPVEDSPTITLAATQAGTLMGTTAYMSPEQARAETVDKRADVWAFGVVLWEMLVGRRFQGKTTSDVLAAVIRDEPDLGRVPAKVRPLLKRCLEKDQQRRLRDIGDAMGIVENTAEVQPSPSRLVWALATVATLSMLIAVAVSLPHFRKEPSEAQAIITSINRRRTPRSISLAASIRQCCRRMGGTSYSGRAQRMARRSSGSARSMRQVRSRWRERKTLGSRFGRRTAVPSASSPMENSSA